MLHIVIIMLVVLILFALFLLESEIGFLGLIKSLFFVCIAAAAGGGIYYAVSKLGTDSSTSSNISSSHTYVPKEKWGGIGLGTLCQVSNSNDESFLRIATDRDTDVQAYHHGNEKIYGQLTNDSSGDAQLARRSQINADKNKRAVINRSRFTADSVRKYFEDELDANENKAWWDNDELDAYT